MKIQVLVFNRPLRIAAYFGERFNKTARYLVGLAVLLSAMGVPAADSLPPIQIRSNAPRSLERRVETLERRLSSQTLMEILNQLEALKKEVQELRGGIEETTHALEGVKKRQRNLYLDVDQRLQTLEGSGNVSQLSETPEYSEQGENITETPQYSERRNISETPQPREKSKSISATAEPSTAKKPSSEEASSYRKAYQILQDRRYNTAIQQLTTFLETYPNGPLAGNAQYWLGEAFYSRRDFPQAKEAFSKVLEEHPNSSKAADALLKLGFVEYELGNWTNSNQRLKELIGSHPNSTAAKLAEKRLQQLRKEKH